MKYSHDEIQKMLNPLFEYMKEVHPTNCKLVINTLSAELVYEHRDQMWMSDDFHNKYGIMSKEIEEFAKSPEMQKLKDKLFAGTNPLAADKSPTADCCCDMGTAEQAIPSWINSSSSRKDCTTTTSLFNKESE